MNEVGGWTRWESAVRCIRAREENGLGNGANRRERKIVKEGGRGRDNSSGADEVGVKRGG